jgi:hypothetical protein
MKKPRKRTQRGMKYEALAEGYKILKSPLAGTFEAASEHFEQRDENDGPGQKSNEPNPSKDKA